MQLPFTIEEFLDVFGDYNRAVWPAQWVLYALAIATVVLVLVKPPAGGRVVAGILAAFWAWMAVTYHWLHFAAINPTATLFAVLFCFEAAALAWLGGIQGQLRFERVDPIRAIVGGSLVAYALAVYPLLNRLAGHRYPESPTFGLPCPTTIFTLGVLCLAGYPFPRIVFLVPLFWAVVGGSAALLLGVPQDLGLWAAGAAGLGVLLLPRVRVHNCR